MFEFLPWLFLLFAVTSLFLLFRTRLVAQRVSFVVLCFGMVVSAVLSLTQLLDREFAFVIRVISMGQFVLVHLITWRSAKAVGHGTLE